MHKIVDTPSASHNPMCYQGMVTSPHYLASAAGLDILRRGGNALESAIAMATTLAVVYPHMCSLGADGFFLVYTANDQKLRALNGSGRAAKKASLKYFEDLGYKSIPERGPLAANTVPGLILALEKIHKLSTESLGGRFAWAELLKDATTYAEEGCPCATSLAQVAAKIASFLKKQAQDFSFAAEFQRCLYPLGQPLKIGERLRQVDLANSLKTLASEGAESFYQGSLCEKIFRDPLIQEGLLSKEDFASAQAAWVEPLTIPYGPYLACNTPPNSQGLASLEILNILQEADLASLGLSAKYYHLVVEATKAAFFDRDQYLSDPDFVKIPIDELLSKEHAKKQFQKINKQASCFPTPLAAHGDTVWFGVCDNYGNAVSAIQSIFYEFGSLVIPKGTGIIFQNRGCYFSLDPNKPNVLAPKKRTLHTLNPAMLLKNGRPYLIYGTMGGEGQPQTQAALVTHLLHHKMTPAEAIASPRWLFGRSFGESKHNTLTLEARIPSEIQDELRALGHDLKVTQAYDPLMGHAGLILVDDELKCLRGASDPRGDGLCLGF